jgi:superfamily I DNA and RNA helicase
MSTQAGVPHWSVRVNQAVRDAKIPVVGREDVGNVRSVFGDSAVINASRSPRDEDVPEATVGGLIEDNESAEKNLSAEQQELSRLEIAGHPRVIRGVAGSGKTVVLANMVARYLSRNTSQELFSDDTRRL